MYASPRQSLLLSSLSKDKSIDLGLNCIDDRPNLELLRLLKNVSCISSVVSQQLINSSLKRVGEASI